MDWTLRSPDLCKRSNKGGTPTLTEIAGGLALLGAGTVAAIGFGATAGAGAGVGIAVGLGSAGLNYLYDKALSTGQKLERLKKISFRFI